MDLGWIPKITSGTGTLKFSRTKAFFAGLTSLLMIIPAAPANAAPANAALSSVEAHGIGPATPIVVLGARLEANCMPPAVLNARLNRAASFSRVHPHNPIIVTGGVTRQGCPSEALAMEVGLRARLLPNPITRDDRAGNTVENAANVARLRPHNKFMVLVTSGDHCARASKEFAKKGIATKCVASA